MGTTQTQEKDFPIWLLLKLYLRSVIFLTNALTFQEASSLPFTEQRLSSDALHISQRPSSKGIIALLCHEKDKVLYILHNLPGVYQLCVLSFLLYRQRRLRDKQKIYSEKCCPDFIILLTCEVLCRAEDRSAVDVLQSRKAHHCQGSFFTYSLCIADTMLGHLLTVVIS